MQRPGNRGAPRYHRKKSRAGLRKSLTKTAICYPLVYEFAISTGEVLRSWRVWDEVREASLPPDFIRLGRTLSRDDLLYVEGRLQLDSAGRLSIDGLHVEIRSEGPVRSGKSMAPWKSSDVRFNVEAATPWDSLSAEGRGIHQTSGLRFEGQSYLPTSHDRPNRRRTLPPRPNTTIIACEVAPYRWRSYEVRGRLSKTVLYYPEQP